MIENWKNAFVLIFVANIYFEEINEQDLGDADGC